MVELPNLTFDITHAEIHSESPIVNLADIKPKVITTVTIADLDSYKSILNPIVGEDYFPVFVLLIKHANVTIIAEKIPHTLLDVQQKNNATYYEFVDQNSIKKTWPVIRATVVSYSKLFLFDSLDNANELVKYLRGKE